MNKVKEIRRERKISRHEMSKSLGITKFLLQSVEAGEQPNITIISKICKYFKLPRIEVFPDYVAPNRHTNIDNVIKDLNSINTFFRNWYTSLNAKLDSTNKHIDAILHKIELSELTYEEKIQVIDSLKGLRRSRRTNKTDLLLHGRYADLDLIDSIIKTSENLVNIHSQFRDKGKQLKSSIDISTFETCEKTYNTESDRIRLTSELQKKYTSVKVDSLNKKIIGYNKCGGAK